MECHHCGSAGKIYDICPECHQENSLILCGPGIERIEEEVKRLFPDSRIKVISKDQNTKTNQVQTLLHEMEIGNIDILIGTQIVTKGYHFPKLSLVGVIDADLGFIGGDLKSTEKTFQLLYQVGGRAGRDKKTKGKVKDEENKIKEPYYKLKYDCIENEKEQYSWCPLKNPIQKPQKLHISKKKGHDKLKIKSQKQMNPADYQHEGYLLRAADNFDKVKINQWYNGKLALPTLINKKYSKGYCRPPPIKTKKKLLKIEEKKKAINTGDKDTGIELTFDNYIPNNCSPNLTPSKGGYNRNQLFNFGVNYLKIPYTKLMKNPDTQLDKSEMCKIINNKYRQIKTQGKEITDKDRLEAYSKKIEDCENGESKGGYSLKELQEIGINYFDLDEETAKVIHKDELCQYIRKRLKKIQLQQEAEKDKKTPKINAQKLLKQQQNTSLSTEETDKLKKYIMNHSAQNKTTLDNLEEDSNHVDTDNVMRISRKDRRNLLENDLSYEYPADINLCKETPNRGGLGSKEIKQIARDNFGIITEHKHKDEICDEIEQLLKKGKPNKKVLREREETQLDINKIKRLTDIDEFFESVITPPSKNEINSKKMNNSVNNISSRLNNNLDINDNIDKLISKKSIQSSNTALFKRLSKSAKSLNGINFTNIIDNE